MRLKTIAATLLIAFLGACAKTGAPTTTGQAATVMMKDGSTFGGTVTASDTASITVQSATGETRTIPMAQVSSVQYGAEAPAPMTAQAPPQQMPQQQAQMETKPSPTPPSMNVVKPVAPVRPMEPMVEFRTIPAGTMIEVRNNESINSETAAAGQTYSAVVARNISDTEGRVAIPRGSNATLIVRSANDQGRVEGRSELVLDVASVAVEGRTYRLETQDLVERGSAGLGKNKRTGEFVGGGAALGGIIGAIAGGGKGAAIGAASGAGAGAATQTFTRGKAVRVPSETILDFKLEAPIRIRELR